MLQVKRHILHDVFTHFPGFMEFCTGCRMFMAFLIHPGWVLSSIVARNSLNAASAGALFKAP
jgi:hypothetical protein